MAPPGRSLSIARSGLAGAAGPLPFLSQIQASFGGHRLDDVSVHRGPEAARAARALGAAGFTLDQRVVLPPGASLAVAAHEAAHVVWQRAGRAPTGRVPSPSDPAERRADAVAARVVAGRSAADLLPPPRRAPAVAARGALELAVLGQLPEGADPGSATGALTRPTATTAQGVLEEMRRYVEAVAAERRAAGRAQDADALVRTTAYGVVGSGLTIYAPGGQQRTFPLGGRPVHLSTGFYLSEGLALEAAAYLEGEFGFFAVLRDTAPDAVRGMAEWFTPEVSADLRGFLASTHAGRLLFAIPAASSARGSGTGFAWAETQVDHVRRRLRELAGGQGTGARGQRGQGGQAGPQSQPGQPDRAGQPGQPPAPARDLPDRVVAWHNERGAYVNVWVGGVHRALALQEGESEESLLARIRAAAGEMRDDIDPAQSTRVTDGATDTGFVPPTAAEVAAGAQGHVPQSREEALPGSDRIANAPAYPAQVINYGPDITVRGATNRFQMRLDFAPAGGTLLDQVAARMQPINFYWELLDVTSVRPEDREAVTRGTAVGGGTTVSRGSGVGRDLGRRVDEIGEDTSADLQDLASASPLEIAATWQARAAWLGVIGISNTVRLAGGLISSFVDIVTTPRDEQSIGWDREGDFLIRCVATPHVDEESTVIRASSVAATAVRVRNINTRAREANDEEVDQLRRLREQLATTPEGPQREDLLRQIAAIEQAGRANVADNANGTLRALRGTLQQLAELEEAERLGTPRERRSPEARLLDVQIQLAGISIAEFRRSVEQQVSQLEALLARSREFAGEFAGPNFRPRVTLASEENGQVIQMLMMLGEAPGSTDGARRWSLVDVTSQATKQAYHGRSSQAGVAGHQEAIRNAFADFRDNGEYGRGSLAVRLPDTLGPAVGGTVTVEPILRMAPGTRRRVMQRLSDLATAAEVAGLVVGGPAGLIIGGIGGLAGAVVAVDSMVRRASGHRLGPDFQTAMDVLSIVGGIVGVAGAVAAPLGRLPRWVNRVERTQRAIHIFGVTQLGAQVFIIPYQLVTQLQQIDETPGLSEGERAARRAEAFLSAVRSGVVSIVSAAQMLESHPVGQARDVPLGRDPVEVPHPTEGEPGARQPVGPAEGEAAPHVARPTAPPRPADLPPARRAALEPGLGELQGRVRLAEGSGLDGTSCRVRLVGDEVVVEVGPDATAQHVADHVSTAQVYLRFRGPIGRIRRLIDRLLSLLRIDPGFGTRGHEARLEVRKLNEIIGRLEALRDRIQERLRQADGPAGSDARLRAIDEEIALLEPQLRANEALVDSYQPGRGFVAAFGTLPEATLTTLQGRYPRDSFTRTGEVLRINDQIELRFDTIGRLDGAPSGITGRSALDVLIEAARLRQTGSPLPPEIQGAVRQVIGAGLGADAAVSPALRESIDPAYRANPEEAARLARGEVLSPDQLRALESSRPDLAAAAEVFNALATRGLPPEPIRGYLLGGQLLPEARARIAAGLQEVLSDPRPVTPAELAALPGVFPAPQDLASFLRRVAEYVPSDALARPRMLRLLLEGTLASPAAMLDVLQRHASPGRGIDESLGRFNDEERATAQFLEAEGGGQRVLALPRAQDFRLGDALIGGRLHDFKAIEGTGANTIQSTIEHSSSGGAQAGTVVLDARALAANPADAVHGIGMASVSPRLHAELTTARVLTSSFEVVAQFERTGLGNFESRIVINGDPANVETPPANRARGRVAQLAQQRTGPNAVTRLDITFANVRITLTFPPPAAAGAAPR